MIDTAGKTVFVNARMASILGYSESELMSESCLFFIDPDHLSRVRDKIDSRRRGVNETYDSKYRHRTGAENHLRVWAAPLYDEKGEFAGSIAIHSDITSVKAAEDAAIRSESKTQKILDAIPDPVFVKDEGHRWIYGNEAFSKIIGKPLEEYRGKSDHDVFPGEMAGVFWTLDQALFDSGRANENEEQISDQTTGEMRTILTKKTPCSLPDGEIILVGVIRDVTERVRNKKAMEDQSARIAAASKMSALGEMAGGIAHEINNPLSFIQILAESMLEAIGEATPDLQDLRVSATKIGKMTHRIAQTIQGLRSFSRGGEQDSTVITGLAEVVDNTLVLCRDRFRTGGVELRSPMGSIDCLIACRATQISQVLLNLLNNAFDAVSGTDGAWVELSISEEPDSIRIAVEDSGPGIPAEVRAKMFQPFFTTKAVGKGTGLGLSISRGIMQGHRGSLSLDEDCSRTRFVIRLPRARGE